MNYQDCIICGLNSWKQHLHSLCQCTNCGYIRAKNRYFKTDSLKLYGPDYFIENDYADYLKERPALEKNFFDRLRRIKKYKKQGRLLEIGCAYGFFINLAKKNFKTTGIELHPKIAQIARNLSSSQIISGEFLKKRLKTKSFDLITMFDVIEHLKYPKEYLKKIYKILKPGGIVIIETGDIGALLPKIQKEKWRLIKPPIHLQYFSKRTLTKFLEDSGFKILKIEYVPFYRTLFQYLYKVFHIERIPFPLKYFLTIPVSINTYDLILVVAQKSKFSRK